MKWKVIFYFNRLMSLFSSFFQYFHIIIPFKKSTIYNCTNYRKMILSLLITYPKKNIGKKLIRAKLHTEPSDIFSPGVILPDFLHPDSHISHNGVNPSKCCCSRILLIGLLSVYTISTTKNKKKSRGCARSGKTIHGRFFA